MAQGPGVLERCMVFVASIKYLYMKFEYLLSGGLFYSSIPIQVSSPKSDENNTLGATFFFFMFIFIFETERDRA